MEEAELYTDHEFVPVVRSPGGWALAFVHYSADPSKDEDWAMKAKERGESDDWEKEQEINFSSVHGVRCFENFSLIANTDDELVFDKSLPLCLCCDFNVEPMAWLVAQVQADETLCFIDEIWARQGSVPENCNTFLNKYGDFYGELRIYGDHSGTHRGQQDNQKSNYDIMKIYFQQSPFYVRMKVPSRNPSNINAVAATNLRLKDKFGNPRVKIHPQMCPNLIRDLVEVVWKDGTKHEIKKERKREKPYFWRTHCSDAAMYIISREWPTRKELSRKTGAEKDYDEKRMLRKRNRKKRRLIGAMAD